MTTSGTATFTVDVITALEEAFERAGVPFRSGYSYESAVRSMNLLFNEWANRGINLWTVEQISVPITQGMGIYLLPADTVDVVTVVLSTQGNDYRIERRDFDAYAAVVKKDQQSRPSQYYVERLTAQPRLTIWPVPDKPYDLKLWRLRRIQDAGVASNTLDTPFRFNEALIAGVALRIGEKNPNLDQARLQLLQTRYNEAMMLAQGEDRDRSSFWLRPNARGR